MDLITLVILLIIIGAAISIVPMEASIKRAIVILVLVVVALILLRAFVGPVPINFR